MILGGGEFVLKYVKIWVCSYHTTDHSPWECILISHHCEVTRGDNSGRV